MESFVDLLLYETWVITTLDFYLLLKNKLNFNIFIKRRIKMAREKKIKIVC